MPLTITTPNMQLALPVPGPTGQLGPTWATDNNNAFSLIDTHDHSSGKGVKVTPAGLNINADLSFGGFTATGLKASAYDNNTSTLTTGLARRVFVLNGDLYYRNNAGSDVRITNGAVLDVASVGGITGDYSSSGAAVSYSNTAGVKAYSFVQGTPDTSVYASMLHADISIYEKVVGGNRIKISAPGGLAPSYDLTLPASLPGSGSAFLRVASTGAITASVEVDNSTLEVSGSSLRAKDLGIVTGKLGNNAVTNAKLANTVSSSSGAASGDITGAETTILTSGGVSNEGRAVFVYVEPTSSSAEMATYGAADGQSVWRIKANGVTIASRVIRTQTSGNLTSHAMPFCTHIDAASSYNYTLTVESAGTNRVVYTAVRLRAVVL